MSGNETNSRRVQSPKELEVAILQLAKSVGVIPHNKVVGFEWEQPEPKPQVIQEKGFTSAIWPWRRLAIECLNYSTVLSLASLQVTSHTTNVFAKAQYSLLTKVSLDIQAILQLIALGFPQHANIVLSSTIESLELAAGIWIEPGLAENFIAVETPDEANHFWHKFVAKNKTRRLIDDQVEKLIGKNDIDACAYSEWRTENMQFFGATRHASYMTPFLSIYSKTENDVGYLPGQPICSLTSVRTVQALASSTVDLASAIGISTKSRKGLERSQRDLPKRFFEEDFLNSYAGKGHMFIQKLWIYYLERQDLPPFSLWREKVPVQTTPI